MLVECRGLAAYLPVDSQNLPLLGVQNLPTPAALGAGLTAEPAATGLHFMNETMAS